MPQAIGRAMEWPATTATAASGGCRELLLGPRPARRKQSEADAGYRNPDNGTALAVTERAGGHRPPAWDACVFVIARRATPDAAIRPPSKAFPWGKVARRSRDG